MVSHDCVAFYLLSQEVARHVKVVQSGQGADEVFAGYHWYPPMGARRGGLGRGVAGGLPGGVLRSRRRGHGPAGRLGRGSPADDPSSRFVADHFAAPGAATGIDRALRLDTKVMLVDDPVKRVDNMTMAWGLEARVPFLDHELVELAATCPPELKIAHDGKGVLKEAARRVIPSEVIDRPKGYFPVPALTHLEGPYLEMVRDALHAPAAGERGLFRDRGGRCAPGRPERRASRPLRGNQLWQLGLLELWLQHHGITGRPVSGAPGERRRAEGPAHPSRAGARGGRRRVDQPRGRSARRRDPRVGARAPATLGGTRPRPSPPPRGTPRRATSRRPWTPTSSSTPAGAGWCSARPSPTSGPLASVLRQEVGGRRDICLYLRDPHVLRGPPPPRVLHRPVLHLPAPLRPGRHPAEPQRTRGRGASHRGTRRRRGHGPHLRALRHGPGPARGAVAQPRRHRPRALPGRRGGRRPARSWAPSPASTTRRLFDDPEGGSSLWCLAVDPEARCPASARR